MESAKTAQALPSPPKVFLSSVFKDSFGGDFQTVPLRRRILDEKAVLPVELWAYELFWSENSEKPDPDADTIIDRCFAGIKSADLFVFLLTGRHGSRVSYFEDPTLASYLELELFAAAALQKPILVLHERGHEPEEALRDTMVLLKRAFASGAFVVDDEKGLYDWFLAACDSLAAGTLKFNETSILYQLPEWLSIQRSKRNLQQDILDPSLAFLDGKFEAGKSDVDPDRAKRLLDQVSSGARSVAGQQKALPHGSALFRIWAAMRDLMDKKSSTLNDPATAPLWDRAFGLWSSNASWFGLHGHLWMGPLAAINSQIGLRTKFATSAKYNSVLDVREPFGARASAIYSIAQRMASRRRKFWHYHQVVRLATLAIEQDRNSQQGALSVRAHALMRMAQLGHVWDLWGASSDFKESLELRTKSAASPASIGEAMSDLGFCKVLTAQRRTGLSLLRDGVALLRSDKSPNGKAFLARGLRKLELAAKISGARTIMNQAHEERLMLSKDIEALDQARDI